MLNIPLNGLRTGKTTFSRHLGKEFFESFDNSEALDADLVIEAEAKRDGESVAVDCAIEGTLTIPCDRCLDPLPLPIKEMVRLSIRPGREDASPDSKGDGDGREIVLVSPDETDFDLAQTVYDYTLLALPLQRVHPEGGCNPEVVKYLGSENVKDDRNDNPFAALRGLLKN